MVWLWSCAALNQLSIFKTTSQVLLFALECYFTYDSVDFLHIPNASLINVIINKQK